MHTSLAASITLLVLATTVAWAEEPAASDGRFDGKPVAHWLVELEQEDLGARRQAAYALFKIGKHGPEAANPLAEAVGDEDDYVRDTAYKALLCLGKFPPSVSQILRSHLNDGRPRVRQLAMWALLRINPSVAFRDDDFDVRKAAIAVVINPNDFFDERVFRELVGRLEDEDAEIRSLSANAIGNAYCFHGQKRPYVDGARTDMTRAFVKIAGSDEDAIARQWSIYALQWIEKYPRGAALSEVIMPALLAGTRDEDADVRWQSFISLGGVGRKGAKIEAAFLAGLADSETRVRQAAASWVGSATEGGHDVFAALIPLLGDDDRSTRRAAAQALGAFRDRAASAVPALIARLRAEKREGVRATVAATLGEIGPAAGAAVPILEASFSASKAPPAGIAFALVSLGSGRSREALSRLVDVAISDGGGLARYWLGRVGQRAAPVVPRLVRALTEGEASSRVAAAWTLRDLGTVALPAVPALEAIVKDGGAADEALVSAARDAIGAIRGD